MTLFFFSSVAATGLAFGIGMGWQLRRWLSPGWDYSRGIDDAEKAMMPTIHRQARDRAMHIAQIRELDALLMAARKDARMAAKRQKQLQDALASAQAREGLHVMDAGFQPYSAALN